jgi:hypothetical protein
VRVTRECDGARRHVGHDVAAVLAAASIEEVRSLAEAAHREAQSPAQVSDLIETVLWGWGVKLDDDARRFVAYMARAGTPSTTARLCGLVALSVRARPASDRAPVVL